MKKRLGIIVPLLLVATCVVLYFRFFRPSTSSGILTVSGNIEATDSQLSFRIPGRLLERLADEGVFVKKGQLIARLDPKDQELGVKRADANAAYARAVLDELEAGTRPEDIERARARAEQARAMLLELRHGSRPQEIKGAEAQLEGARAAVTGARSQFEIAKADYERYRDLFAQHVVSARDYDEIRRRRDAAKSGLEEAEAQLEAARQGLSLREEGPRKEQIEQAEASLKDAEAAYALAVAGPRKEQIQQAEAQLRAARESLEEARRQLAYTDLYAPYDGVILSKAAEPGEYLQPGSPVVTLGDLNHPWLRAYVNETHLGRIHLGQRAEVTTDAYPDKEFQGVIGFIGSEAEFTPKTVQTFEERVKLMYRIKIDLQNPDGLLKPGMPADGRIHIQ